MSLSLPDDFPADHITWYSRGYFYEPPIGYSPTTAPGYLSGLAYSKVFRRTGDSQFAIRGIKSEENDDNYCYTVWNSIRAIGPKSERQSGMFNSLSENIDLLDGNLYYYAADYGFSGPPTLTLHGNRALRLVCYRLGLRQPRQFSDEGEIPSSLELETQLLEQLRQIRSEN